MKYAPLGLLIVSSIAVAGLGPARHQDPTTGPAATIHFQDESGEYSLLRVSYQNPYRCTDKRIVTFFDDPLNTSIKVNTQNPFTFRTTYVLKMSAGGTFVESEVCAITLTLPVEADREYRVVSNIQNKTCDVRIDAKQEGGSWTRISDVAERKFKVPFIESQGFCAADERFKQFDKRKK